MCGTQSMSSYSMIIYFPQTHYTTTKLQNYTCTMNRSRHANANPWKTMIIDNSRGNPFSFICFKYMEVLNMCLCCEYLISPIDPFLWTVIALFVFVYLYICVFVYLCICVFVYIWHPQLIRLCGQWSHYGGGSAIWGILAALFFYTYSKLTKLQKWRKLCSLLIICDWNASHICQQYPCHIWERKQKGRVHLQELFTLWCAALVPAQHQIMP